ncbi:MAG: hypothetical protein AAB840_02380 [Patescibacteria group bacterium]
MNEEMDNREGFEEREEDFSDADTDAYVPTRAEIAKFKKTEKKEEKKARHRISNTTVVLLVGVALSVDLVEFVSEWLGIGLILSPLISIYAGLTFWFWLNLKGVNFIGSPKRFITGSVTFLAEIIPGLDAIGGFLWTVGMIILVIIVRAEDETGLSFSMIKGGAKAGKLLRPNLASARERTLSVGARAMATRKNRPLRLRNDGRGFTGGLENQIGRKTIGIDQATNRMLKNANRIQNSATSPKEAVVNRLDLNKERLRKLRNFNKGRSNL